MILQIIRRFTQVTVVVVVAAVAMLSLYAHYRSARVIDDEQLMSGMRGEVVTQMIHPYVDALEDPQTFLDGQKGILWSMRLMGVELTDPLAALEMLATSKTFHAPLWISILIPVGLTLVLGKVFCSWMCPAYLLFELTGKLRKLLRLAEIRPGRVRFSYVNKYIFLVAGLAMSATASAPLFALIYPPAVISRAMHAWIFGTAMTGMVILLSVIVAMEVFVSPRWWCRTMCPGGALYGLIGWLRPVRIKLKVDKCTNCMECLPVCEAGLNPITQSSSIECDNCGVCIRHCHDKALVYAIGLPDPRRSTAHARKVSGLRPRRAQAPTVTLVALLTILGVTNEAAGHHILGLPHYSYKEHYPQRPTLEYPASTGPYDILLTSYPGLPTPGEAANLAFYIKNRDTGRVYTQPITVRILQTSTFGDNTVVMPSTRRRAFDNQFKFYATFPEDGEYIVELSMHVEGRVEVIPFLMVAGEPTATASLAIAGTFTLVMVFVVIRAIQKKRRRRQRHAGISSRTASGNTLVALGGRRR